MSGQRSWRRSLEMRNWLRRRWWIASHWSWLWWNVEANFRTRTSIELNNPGTNLLRCKSITTPRSVNIVLYWRFIFDLIHNFLNRSMSHSTELLLWDRFSKFLICIDTSKSFSKNFLNISGWNKFLICRDKGLSFLYEYLCTMSSASDGERDRIFLAILVWLTSEMRCVGETVDFLSAFLRG